MQLLYVHLLWIIHEVHWIFGNCFRFKDRSDVLSFIGILLRWLEFPVEIWCKEFCWTNPQPSAQLIPDVFRVPHPGVVTSAEHHGSHLNLAPCSWVSKRLTMNIDGWFFHYGWLHWSYLACRRLTSDTPLLYYETRQYHWKLAQIIHFRVHVVYAQLSWHSLLLLQNYSEMELGILKLAAIFLIGEYLALNCKWTWSPYSILMALSVTGV